MIEFEPHDLDLDLTDIGLTIDDLDLPDCDLPAVPLNRARWRSPEWWETTAAEEHHLNLPTFTSHSHRAAWFIREMAHRSLVSDFPGIEEDDAVFPLNGRLMSLNELLRPFSDDLGLDGYL